MDRKPNYKKYSLFKDLLQAISLLMFVVGFFSWQMYLLMFNDSKYDNMPKIESPKSKINNVINRELRLYAETGKFSTDTNHYLSEDERRSGKYSIKIKLERNRLIISIFDSTDSILYSAFGVIKILESKPNSDIHKKGVWQQLKTLSFVCNYEKPGTPLPNDLDIVNLNDKCPVGYTQIFKKKEKLAKLL
jgi:hypothetical protein